MDQTPSLFPTIVTERRRVPNSFPALDPGDCRIAIIGEAPGEQEESYGIPFVGPSGQFLTNRLRDVGINRHMTFVGNVVQQRPSGNDISRFDWNGPEFTEGFERLRVDLNKFDPNICLLLGNVPIHASRYGTTPPHRKGKKIEYQCAISEWCGSLFVSQETTSPFFNRKCIPAFHPAGILRSWDSNYFRFGRAAERALGEARNKELILPKRELVTNLTAYEICGLLDSWTPGQRCALDIEGGLPKDAVNLRRLKPRKGARPFGWPCVSVSARPSKGFTLVWSRYSDYERIQVLRSFARLMWREDVPKVLQNSLYDTFVLSYGYGILVRNVAEDTMLKSWCIYAELPRSLSCQASIYTREPHWKDDSMYKGDGEGLYRGCALDSCVTIECCEAQDGMLHGKRLEHYRAIMEIRKPFAYMQERGVRYDITNVLRMLQENGAQMLPVRQRLRDWAGYDICGETSISSKKLIACLYLGENKSGFKYEPQYKKEEGGRKGTTLTSDIEAILNLKKHNQADPFLADVALHRHLEGIRETLQIEPDPDGRVRCGYSLEAETGRVKCYTSPTGSGANLQTIQKSLRGNYTADPDYDFFQCDLEGADGWTVAARCAALGDDTMLLDYQAGMKPAKIIGLLYWFGSELNKLDRDSLKFHHERTFPIIKKAVGSWLYLGCKRVYHGTDYLMGIPTMQLNVLKDSFKESGVPVYMGHAEAKQLQSGCMLARYVGVPYWHSWAEATVAATGKLESANGSVREFFGRRFGKDIKDTVKEFLAHEPQSNTTWATNLAALNLWRDPANRVVSVSRKRFTFTCGDGYTHYWAGSIGGFDRIHPGALVIEPLHQVHDALCGQWPKFLCDWARPKVKSYFNNTLRIAGIDLVIPFEGNFGPSWGDQPYSL